MKFNKPLLNVVVDPLATAPSSPTDGQVYYDNVLHVFRARVNGAWQSMAALEVGQTFSSPRVFGTTGNVNDIRIKVNAETTGQIANTMEFWSGTDTGQGGASQKTSYFNEKGEFRVICAASNSTGIRFKGQPSQSVNVMEHTDTSNNAIAWMGPDGSWRAPNMDFGPAWSINGTVATGVGTKRWYNDTGQTLTIRSVRVTADTAPTGSAITIDVNKNGTTIFTTQANRPTIAATGHTSGKVTNMDVTTLADGDYVTFDVDAVGSTIAGSNLTVHVVVY